MHMTALRVLTRTARRMARRHKMASAALAACVAGAVAVGMVAAGTGGSSGAGGTTPQADPLAAAFTLPALGSVGPHVSLSQYDGRPLIVNFFASWCAPCRKETPLLARFYRSEHGRVLVVGLDENDAAGAARAFVRAAGVTYPVGFDPSARVAIAYGVIAIPQTFFLNSSHHVVKRVYGAVTMAELKTGTALMRTP